MGRTPLVGVRLHSARSTASLAALFSGISVQLYLCAWSKVCDGTLYVKLMLSGHFQLLVLNGLTSAVGIWIVCDQIQAQHGVHHIPKCLHLSCLPKAKPVRGCCMKQIEKVVKCNSSSTSSVVL